MTMNKALLSQALKCVGTWARKRVRERRTWTWEGHQGQNKKEPWLHVGAIALLSGRRVVTGGHDGGIMVWNADTGELLQMIATTPSYRNRLGIAQLAVLADGRVVVAGESFCSPNPENQNWTCHHPAVLNLDTAGVAVAQERHLSWITAIVPLAGNAFITGGEDGRLKLWRDVDCLATAVIDYPGGNFPHASQVVSLIKLGDGSLASLSGEVCGTVDYSPQAKIDIWSIEADAIFLRRTIDLPGITDPMDSVLPVVGMVSIGGNKVLVSICDDTGLGLCFFGGTHHIWDLDSGTRVAHFDLSDMGWLLARLPAADGTMNPIAVLPDGRFAAPGRDGNTIVWNWNSPEEATPARNSSTFWEVRHRHAPHAPGSTQGFSASFRSERPIITAIASLGDGRYVTGANDGTLKVWTAPPASSPGTPVNYYYLSDRADNTAEDPELAAIEDNRPSEGARDPCEREEEEERRRSEERVEELITIM